MPSRWSRITAMTVLASVGAMVSGPLTRADDKIVYRGRISVGESVFNGTGYFKFVLSEPDGQVVWRNFAADAAGVPINAIPLSVIDGAYTVVLGGSVAAMPPLPPEIANVFPALQLRIWFSNGDGRFHRISPAADLSSGTVLVQPPKAAGARTAPVVAEASDGKRSTGPPRTPERPPVSARQVPVKHRHPPAAQRSPATPGGRFKLPDREHFSVGSSTAPVVMIEFADFQCGHCQLFHEVTFPKIKSEYIDTGLLLYISGNFPLQRNVLSVKGAQAAYCAGDQGRFWEMRHSLFMNGSSLSEQKFVELAREMSLDVPRFYSCLEKGKYAQRVVQDKAEGTDFGVKQTPSFILGRVRGMGEIEGGLIQGAKLWTAFNREINPYLEMP